ncbi:hypothetical protein [Serratia fonticola]|uniref:hypothetical protein n=1 Tax=Serratia fonticola TaxID=47917 RepID=UPI001C489360|nr:hypothetical protein [Serratia fonticola]QXN61762.1 hypothetical protein J8M99_20950 [Serratia fonticola]
MKNWGNCRLIRPRLPLTPTLSRRARELPGFFDEVVLLRKVGNKNKNGKVLRKTINELDRFPWARELPDFFDEVVLLRKVGNKKRKGLWRKKP